MQKTWVWSLSWEDPLEKGMTTHSSILAWRIPRTEEPGGLQSIGSQRVRHDWATNTFTSTYLLSHPVILWDLFMSLEIALGKAQVQFSLLPQFSSVAQSCQTLCNPMDYSMPGFPVFHQLLELFKLMFIQSVMPSNHLILCHPFLLLTSIFPSIRVFSKESVLHIRWPKYWSFSFSISPSN